MEININGTPIKTKHRYVAKRPDLIADIQLALAHGFWAGRIDQIWWIVPKEFRQQKNMY